MPRCNLVHPSGLICEFLFVQSGFPLELPFPRFVTSPQLLRARPMGTHPCRANTPCLANQPYSRRLLCSSGLGFRIIAALRGLSPQCAYRVGRTKKVRKPQPADFFIENLISERKPYRAALMMAAKESAFRAAPPTRAPSMSGWLMSSAALSGFTEPPYCRRTASAAAAPKASATTPRMKA